MASERKDKDNSAVSEAAEASKNKKVYERPVVRKYGSIRDLTLGSATSGTDSGALSL